MNVFVAVKWKRTAHRLDPEVLRPFLASEPEQTMTWRSRNRDAELVCFTYWQDQVAFPYLIERSDSAITFDGFVTTAAAHGLDHDDEAMLWGSCSRDFQDLEGEYCIASVREDRIVATSNLGGGHPLYYIETPACVAFSNRSVLLLQLPGASSELSWEALRWLTYHSYMLRGDTPFRDVKQLLAGDTVSYSTAGGLRVSALTYDALMVEQEVSVEPVALRARFEQHCDAMGDVLRRLGSFYKGSPWSVSMSGGKDSRLVLALILKAGLRDRIGSIFTDGPLYLHDVLSAQDVCACLGLDHHEVRRPKRVHSAVDLDIPQWVESVNLTEGKLATHYQVTADGRDRSVLVTGQQAVRDSHYRNCPTRGHREFVDCVMHSYFHDPAGLLTPAARAAVDESYRRIFEGYFEEDLPIESVSEYYMLRERHSGWTSIMNGASLYPGPVANPLLFSRVYRFVFNIPQELRKNELYHFMVIGSCAAELLEIPFANQQWNWGLKERLQEVMEVPIVAPYVNHRCFPNMSNPYKSVLKLAYFNGLKPFMRELRVRNEARLRENFDLEQVDRVLASETDLPVPALLCASGLYTAFLLVEYGVDVFHRTRNSEIAKEIESLCKRNTSTAVSTSDERYEIALRRHEECIAELSRQFLRGAVNQTDSPSPESSQWYQIRICNGCQKDLDVYLVTTDRSGVARRHAAHRIRAGEEFSWGIQDLGGVSVRVCCDEVGHSEEIVTDVNQLVYYTVIR